MRPNAIRRVRRFFAAALVGLAATFVLAVPATATHSWGNYHWARTSNPLMYDTHANLNLNVNCSTRRAWHCSTYLVISDWSTPTSVEVYDQLPTPGGGCPDQSNTNHNITCERVASGATWCGLATIWPDINSHITGSRAEFNNATSNPACGTTLTQAQMRHVYCQEIGHTLGLDHQYSSTCMNDSTYSYVSPNQHDYDQLNSIYSHADSYNTSHSCGHCQRPSEPMGLSPYPILGPVSIAAQPEITWEIRARPFGKEVREEKTRWVLVLGPVLTLADYRNKVLGAITSGKGLIETTPGLTH